MNFLKKSYFTLIELLVVVVSIGTVLILAALGIFVAVFCLCT